MYECKTHTAETTNPLHQFPLKYAAYGSTPYIGTLQTTLASMPNLSPLRYCFHGRHAMPRAQFRFPPGIKTTRAVCAECYAKIFADPPQKTTTKRR